MASRSIALTLGALAVSSGIALLTFDFIFAVTLSNKLVPIKVNIVAIVASVLGAIAVSLLLLLLGRQIRYRNGAHIQDFGHGRHHTYLLAGFGGVFGILAAGATAVMLGIVSVRKADLPAVIIGTSTSSLVIGAFVVWAIFLISQAVFVVSMVVIQRRDFQHEIQPYHAEPELETFPEMQEPPRHRPSRPSTPHDNAETRGSQSMESKTPPSTGRSRAGSDTMSSFRSSLSQVVRPVTSKTRLIQGNHRSPPHRPTSLDLEHGNRNTSEDGFDSWDTSTVDAQSRQAVESASPTPPRFLETIPASPTGSRSPSPGFPLDLEPPRTRPRSRSYSPANSVRMAKTSRTISPTDSSNEAHIHPLFRTDSPTPPPAATPGTVVTAAPDAVRVLSPRQSIRSLHRMRSGSLPTTPLMHSGSLDSIRHTIEREEAERIEEGGAERTLTPPIPDFILNGGPRNSMQGYNSRKKPPTGLGIVGEIREA